MNLFVYMLNYGFSDWLLVVEGQNGRKQD